MMRKFYFILLLAFSLFPFGALAQSSAGFVPGNIWYFKDPFEEGDKIRIYTVLFNPDQREFSGTVRFFDKSTFLGKKDFVMAGRTVKDISIDWTVTVGEHTIFAKIENAKFLISPGKYEEVYLSDSQTEESKRTVKKKVADKESADVDATGKILDKSAETISNTMTNLGKLIEEKTPYFIAKPIIAATGGIESWRESTALDSKNAKVETKKQLDTAKNDTSKLGRPFKYIKLFFFTLISFIFGNKFIFYGLSVVLAFFFLRYIWHLIF